MITNPSHACGHAEYCICRVQEKKMTKHLMTEKRNKDPLNLNCSSNSSCFLSFCSCRRSKRERGSYSSSGASDEWTNKYVNVYWEIQMYFRGFVGFRSMCMCSYPLGRQVFWLSPIPPASSSSSHQALLPTQTSCWGGRQLPLPLPLHLTNTQIPASNYCSKIIISYYHVFPFLLDHKVKKSAAMTFNTSPLTKNSWTKPTNICFSMLFHKSIKTSKRLELTTTKLDSWLNVLKCFMLYVVFCWQEKFWKWPKTSHSESWHPGLLQIRHHVLTCRLNVIT